MNKKIFVILLFLVCSLFQINSFSQINKEIIFKETKPVKFKISDFAEELKYITLDSKIPLKTINKILFADNNLFIASPQMPLLQYNAKGKLINRFGDIGQGPGQYLYCRSFAVSGNHIAVLSGKKVYLYNTDGKFNKSIEIKHPDYFSSIYFIGNHFVLTNNNANGDSKSNWIILDESGRISYDKKNYINFKTPYRVALDNSEVTYHYNDNLYYFEQFNDTVFQIKPSDFLVNYIFNSGKYKYSPQVFINHLEQIITKDKIEDTQLYFQVQKIIETSKFLFISYRGERQIKKIAFVDKSTNAFITISNHQGFGIYNDIDCNINFKPEYYFYKEEREYIIDWIYPYELKAHIASDSFKNSTPKFPEKKKELEQLANSLDENDNPVLMLVKLKN